MEFRSRYQYNPKTDFINKGGFARVFKAYDNVLDRQVALKVYSQEASSKYDLIADMKRGGRLDHPNLCRYYDVTLLQGTTSMGEEETLQVGVIEYLDGGNIKQYIDAHPEHLTKLLMDVLKGLSYLHKNKIIHRDLTPSNILIKNCADGPIAKITDFGISKVLGSSTTKSSELLGKVEYMAPEQFNPEKYGPGGKISYNLDLWSFGCLVYELIKGESLFGSRDLLGTEQVIMMILDNVDDSKINALPEPFKTAAARCLVKDAKQRIQNAEELIEIISGKMPLTELYHAKKMPTKNGSETIHVDAKKEDNENHLTDNINLDTTDGFPTDIVIESNNKTDVQKKNYGLVKTLGVVLGIPLAILVFILVYNKTPQINNDDIPLFTDSTTVAPDTTATISNLGDTATSYVAYSETPSKENSPAPEKEEKQKKTTNTGTLYSLTDVWGDAYDYKGEIANGEPNGYGVATYENGDKYVGSFLNGDMNGNGTYYYGDVGKYVGQYKNGRRNGTGTLYFENGDKYEGGWKDDYKSGWGIYTAGEGYEINNCPGCSVYKGYWKDGAKSGYGECYSEDGELLYEGYFKSGQPIDPYPNQ